jgi:hypothetical protein
LREWPAAPALLRAAAFVLVATPLPSGHAATLWTGPNLGFTQSVDNPSDTILPGSVVLTRGANDVLYNIAAGETSAGPGSPAGTEWAFGSLTNYSTLAYQSLESMRSGDLALLIIDQPMVMHITNEDIYLSVQFGAWGQHGSGGFSYIRSTPASSVPPTVSITNPAPNSVFAAPANVKIAASATVSGGTVTNVSFFIGATPIGSVQIPPFSLTSSNLAAGPYSLSAVATASGVSATSSVVNITVVSPTPISLMVPRATSGLFSFRYSADPGLSYVVQRSANLFIWAPVVTNVASSNPALFSEGLTTSPSRYYRVGRLPNP